MARMWVLFFLTVFLLPHTADALSSKWLHDGPVDVRLISSLEGVGQKATIPLGLEVHLEPGWHTYWRSPGAAGLPPQFDWTNSLTTDGNLAKAEILYPVPKRFSEQSIDTIGYQNRVVFPINAEVKQVGKALTIDATVNLLVCSDLCVPKTFALNLKVPADKAIEGPEADILNPALQLVPGQDEAAAGLAITKITNNKQNLEIEITSPAAIHAPDIFIESTPEIPFAAPEVKIAPDERSATLTVKPADAKQDLGTLTDTPLLLTVIDDGHALEKQTTLPSVPGSESADAHFTFQIALIMAVIGGFLLNLMPCVLPVLSLKILSLISHGGGSKAGVRRSFLTTAAGIMFSFLLLALMTVILKKLGHTLGWGVQFQQPLFLIALILLLTFFTANMWGLFEINLPPALLDKLSAHHPKMAGDFATGALATLLATPCTAPFLGTAVGFALASGSTREIFGIFIMLGFGMVIPYIFIAAVPEVATMLPKPGAWMVRLRFALGIALALTAAWLLWVLSAQIAGVYALTVTVCMIGIVALLGVHTAGYAKRMVNFGLLALAIIAMSLALGSAPQSGAKMETQWQPFNESEIPIQVAANHVVFVDITADWCLTCQANKKLVLSDDAINHRLFHSDVVAMQGDWTNPDPDITNFLHKFRRYGIPFNVVYGPGAPMGITLPELLSREVVFEALQKAEGH